MHSEYGVDLDEVWRRKSWRWFTTRVKGLLYADTRLSRHFRPPADDEGVSDRD